LPTDPVETHSGSLAFEAIGMTFPDGTEALREISFSLGKSEFVTVVGPSGCGKSTLLRIASGLLEPTAGSVDIDRERLGYVFQDATLLPWRTVQGNVELFAELHGIPPDERRLLARETIDLVGLQGFEGHYPKSLSGGMRMRCSLARSLTLKPQVFLFDEPFGALDEMTREHMQGELLRIWRETETTVVFVTHSIPEAPFLSNRVVVLSPRPGRISSVVEVDLGDRTDDTREDPEFFRVATEVREALRAVEAGE